MPANRLPTFLLFALLLAGCFGPGQHVPPAKCLGDLCLADPSGHDAQYMLTTYGLHQITQGASTKAFPQIEGDLVIWQVAFGNVSGWSSAILGYDIKTETMIPIGVGPLVLHSEAFLAKQRVLWTDEPWNKEMVYPGSHPVGKAQLMLWDAATRQARRIETGLSGSSDSFAFDGTWAIFLHHYSPIPSENAMWAINVDTGQKDRLYLPYPNQTRPDGILELPGSMAVTDGIAYYTIDEVTRRPDQPKNDRVTHLYRAELLANSTHQIYAGDFQFNRIAVEGNNLEFENNLNVNLMDLGTGRVIPLSCPNCSFSGIPSIKNNWAVHTTEFDPHAAFNSVVGRNLKTNATVQFHAEKFEASFQGGATDGNRIVMLAQTFPGHGVDVEGQSPQVYWADLPA